MGRYPGALPQEITGFVGRDRELAALAKMLELAALVTVTGTAGVGKTRVAVRAAASVGGRFADGVCFAELGVLRDPDLVPHAVAASLGLPEQDGRDEVEAVAGYLSSRRALLVLDTCEHVIGGAVALIGTVLRAAPGVTVLATSRQPLDMPAEHVFLVRPLPVGPETAAACPGAVELFAQRAASAARGFTVSSANRREVVQVCQRLDGIPLAIELAAAQLRTLSLGELSGRLEHRFLALAGARDAALPHQQALRTAIGWSYHLCSPAERLLWARVSVFAGSFTIPAAEEVCAGGTLSRANILEALVGLVDKSVVLRPDEPAGNEAPRYRLLDTIREFGAEQLAQSGEQGAACARHVSYFARLAEDFARHDKDAGQLARFRALRAEHANLQAALGYALGAPPAAGGRLAARLASALRPYWEISGLLREGRHWADKILPMLAPSAPERDWLLLTRGVLGIFQGDLEQAVADLEASTATAREHGNELACALSYAYLCLALTFSGRHPEAAAAGAAAGERLEAAAHLSGLVSLDIHLGYLHLLGGRPQEAIDRCAQGLRRLDGSERWARSYLQLITALGLFLQGDSGASTAAAREALRLKNEIGDITGTAYCLEMLAILAAAQARHEPAAQLLGAADPLWERTGARFGGTAAMEILHQQAETTTRDQLGTTRYEKLFRDGANRELSMTVELATRDSGILWSPLTKREQEIGALVRQGLTNSQIARRLHISRRTVDAHTASIYAKLGISSRSQLTTALGQHPDPGNPD
jgi:predicted ATPase/DNA-binding CsgD family transcriptional regulator